MSWKPLVHIITPENSERTVLRAQLLGADYNVAAFHSSDEALSALTDCMPHLIIIDAGHARDESDSFSDLMERLAETDPLPLLHIREPDEGDYVRDIQREGCDDTLTRPIKSLELLSRVGSLLRNRQLLGQIRIQENFLASKDIKPFDANDSPPTVLLVEDEAAESANIRRLLEEVPCNVIEARTPADALWHVKRKTPQLVIVDLLFPDLDGLELCQYLKDQEETKYTPLLMLTSVPELDNRIVGLNSGPDDYLVKPFNNMEVLTRVRRLLNRNLGHQRLIGNNLLLNRHGFTDPSSGIPNLEFFRFVYPEMVNWSQKAQLPFTVARIRMSTEESFLKISSETRSTLRNFDLDFITGDMDLSLILPETPSDKAQIALARILSRARELGIPPWEVRLVTVSIGEDGWDTHQIRDMFKSGPHEFTVPKNTPGNGQKILVAGDSNESHDLAGVLNAQGYEKVETLTLEDNRAPGNVKANLVILQGDLEKVPELLKRLIPSLTDPETPVLIKYTGPVAGAASPSVPDSADYIPPGAGTDYFLHRVRNSLNMAQLRSGTGEVESFLKRLVRLLEEGDADVQGHGQQVSDRAVELGARLGLGRKELESLRWGGLLHDVGKIFLPGKIMVKKDMLTAEEFMVVKSHPRLGYDLCQAFSMLDGALPIIKHHHERIDGKGYPEGLRGDNIPLLARIVSVVDVYDTLGRSRPYRPAFTAEESARILRQEAEKGMWDEKIVAAFLKMIRN
jgi:response regulator RpfG family c-di-GMP phosphodiesterase